MLSVIRVHLPSEVPIVGCELTPYVLLRRPDNTATTDDVPESAPLDGHFLKYRWYRVQSDKKVAICSVHPSKEATLQCLGCLKTKVPVTKSYHCSTKCFTDAWQHHRVLHERAAAEGNDEEELLRLNSSGSVSSILSTFSSLTNGSSSVHPSAITQKTGAGGETLVEVGRSKTYTPMADDVGHVLKFECVVVNAETKQNVGHPCTILTSRVIPAPSPSPRRMIPVSGAVDSNGRPMSMGSFTVLSYNILADTYASSDMYSYCPTWALSWTYRRQNLLREIVKYHADIVCLQEVQNDHFDEFFAPELDKHGYQALFKRKTNEVFVGNTNTIDGCATFYRRDRFSHVKKYEVEFNKAAQSLTEALIPVPQKKIALHRLVKDNVALIVVLEAKFGNQAADIPGKRQLLCVANTHVNFSHELKDVKLWQVHTLLKGLEKIAASADIPMLVCGDFNTVPASAPHSLLAMGKVDPMHPDLMVDPLGILRPHTKLTHQLVSHAADTLTVESLLELLDEESLRKDTALPSPEWSSDHIALLAEFRCMPKTRR